VDNTDIFHMNAEMGNDEHCRGNPGSGDRAMQLCLEGTRMEVSFQGA